MADEHRAELERLVSAHPDRGQWPADRLQSFLNLIVDIERRETERCAAIARRTVRALEQARKWSAARAALDILTAIEQKQ